MNSNQQQSTIINSGGLTTSLSPGSQCQQRNVICQRVGSQQITPSQPQYQIQSTPTSQFSHLHQQVGSNFHKQKQMTSDVQFSNTSGNMPIQNGNYNSIAGSTMQNTMGLENNQLGIQHQQFPYSSQSQGLPNSTVPNHFQSQQITSQPAQTQQKSFPPYQQQNHLITQSQQVHTQSKQQQPLQLQQQNQKNANQHHRYQKQQSQPKQILQHSPKDKSLSTSSSQGTKEPKTILLKKRENSDSQGLTLTNGQVLADKTENERMVSNTSDIDGKQSSDKKTSNASETTSLANTKEKTPMCLINELARFNKMDHQYTLVDEQGPAHKKTFYVKLKLGDEEYSASGESIKKAQHAAAAIALNETKYQHPPPKPARIDCDNLEKTDGTITPTVELNALAMKRGEAAVYKSIEPQQPPYYHQHNMDFRGLYNQRYHQYMRGGRDPRCRGSGVLWPVGYHYPRMNRAFYVALRVGHREFIGDGPTRQAARHNAAQKALRILQNLPLQDAQKHCEEEEVEEEKEDKDDSLKSEISLVHEIALRRNMIVQFDVIRETGPPHMKNFLTRCTVANMITNGEGNSKKSSKKKAAELMLEELKKLPSLPAPIYQRPRSKIQINKKKNRNLIKSELQQQKADPNYGVGINPISRLIQIMQAQKKKEPVYTLITEKGLPRRREFIVQVEVEENSCTGSGPNKKLAKRAAAESMLQLLGYTKPSPQPTKSSFKNPASGENGTSNGDKKVTFVGDIACDESKTSPATNFKKVPGLLHLPNKSSVSTNNQRSMGSRQPVINLANILKPNLRPEIQLRELCKAMEYQLEIDDFTKKLTSGTEHITRITIGSKDNAQSFHGSNTTLESSRDMAALDALKVLVAKAKDIHPGGDGPQVKKETPPRSVLKKDFSK